MTVVTTLSITSVQDGSLSDEIAAAVRTLDNYDIEDERNPMGTVIEADDVIELFATVQATIRPVRPIE